MDIYCVKCREMKEVDEADVKINVAKNGMKMAKAACPDCGTKMCKILGKK